VTPGVYPEFQNRGHVMTPNHNHESCSSILNGATVTPIQVVSPQMNISCLLSAMNVELGVDIKKIKKKVKRNAYRR
jgi:hypothetical protein